MKTNLIDVFVPPGVQAHLYQRLGKTPRQARPRTAAHGAWFSTSTVQALVRRGAAEYTEWRRHGSGEGSQFPVEVMIVKPHKAMSPSFK